MNYELAKKLKDAGFPQTSRDYYCPDKITQATEGEYLGDQDWYSECGKFDTAIPTLSELIEACGDDLFQLVNSTKYPTENKWQAYKVHAVGEVVGQPVLGSTPEEAVANLWLALNKHSTV